MVQNEFRLKIGENRFKSKVKKYKKKLISVKINKNLTCPEINNF